MYFSRHAESLGVDAIAAIPPIYFHLPEYAIAQYWNDISAAAPNTDFVIYNIPQLAGVALTQGLFAEMRKNPNVIGVVACNVCDYCKLSFCCFHNVLKDDLTVFYALVDTFS